MTEPLDIYPWDIEIVKQVYPQANSICSQQGAFDADDNPIELDASLLDPLVAAWELQQSWKVLRQERNTRLAETDWMATSDRTMTTEETAYRQALRDLPSNTTDPASPTWPTKPS